MRHWLPLLSLAWLFLAGGALAQTPDVDATATATEWRCRAKAAPAPATLSELPTASVGLYNVASPSTNLRCVALGPGQEALMGFSLTYSQASPTATLRARAYSGAGCTGEVSLASPNACLATFRAAAPTLVP